MTRKNRLSDVASKLVASVLLLACLSLIWLSWHRGTGNLYMQQGQQLIRHWQQGGQFEHQLFLQAEQSLQTAIDRHPQHPNYPLVLGKLYQWQAFLQPEQAETALNLAYQHLQLSAELRPSWPTTWIDLAQVSYELAGNQWQANSQFYWQQAQQHGALFEPMLNTEISLLMRAWPQISPVQQQQFLQKIVYIQDHHGLSRHLFSQARQHERLAALCTFVGLSQQTERLAASYLYRQNCAIPN